MTFPKKLAVALDIGPNLDGNEVIAIPTNAGILVTTLQSALRETHVMEALKKLGTGIRHQHRI